MKDHQKITFDGEGDQEVRQLNICFVFDVILIIFPLIQMTSCDKSSHYDCCLSFQPGIEAGDVIIILQQKEHETFKRSGNDLYLEKEITLSEALCGFDMVITHLDDRSIKVHCPPGKVIEPGKSLM